MAGRYARLKTEWQMRGWENLPFAVMNWKTADIRPFSDRLAHVARACDGETNFDSSLFLPAHRTLLDKLIENGIVEGCAKGEAILDGQEFRKAEIPYLDGIHWAVTGRCNMRCRHCYMSSPDGGNTDLGDEAIDRIISRFAEANLPQVTLTGGEPFVRKDIFQIIRKLLDRRIRVNQIHTNGVRVTDKALETVKALGAAPVFSLGFDGMGTHDDMRGVPGSESRVLDAVRRIRQAGFQVNIATSIDIKSRGSLMATYDKLRDLDVQSWQISPPHRTGNWQTSSTAISLDGELALYHPLLIRWQKDGCPFHLKLGAMYNSRDQAAGTHRPARQLCHNPTHFSCGVCSSSPYLMPDGTMLPCRMFAGSGLTGMPNLLTEGLSAIWQKSRLKEVAETRKNRILNRNTKRSDCYLFEPSADCGALYTGLVRIRGEDGCLPGLIDYG